MDTEHVQDMVSELGTSIDDLEAALAPFFNQPLSTSASRLPLLDKAKLYVLATYSIESLLFSALRLNGVDAKAHPVFQELARVKEYFSKIKKAEDPHEGRGRLNKDAAERIIKHGLAGNDRYDQERAEGRPKRKLEEIAIGKHTRFDEEAKRLKAGEPTVTVVKASELEGIDTDHRHGNQLSVDSDAAEQMQGSSERKKDKKHKHKSRKHNKPAGGECYGAVLE